MAIHDEIGNRDALYAGAMIDCIKTELTDASYFTREDLLHLSCFNHVATITRYHYVCAAVRYSIDRRWIMAISRTDLILTGGKKKYTDSFHTLDEYEDGVKQLAVIAGRSGQQFGVMDLVHEWENDPHLTVNSKRTIVRGLFKRWVREGFIEQVLFSTYRIVRR